MNLFLRKHKSDKPIVQVAFAGMFLSLIIISKLISGYLKFGLVEINIALAFLIICYHSIGFKWVISILPVYLLISPAITPTGYSLPNVWGNFIEFLSWLSFISIYILVFKSIKKFNLVLVFITSVLTSWIISTLIIYIFNIFVGYPVYYYLLNITSSYNLETTIKVFENSPTLNWGMSYYGGIFVQTLVMNLVKETLATIIALSTILTITKKRLTK